MRDIGLVKAFLVVSLFWLAVFLTATNGFAGVLMLPEAIVNAVLVILIGCIVGFSTVTGLRYIDQEAIKALHGKSTFRGMTVSIGIFPSMANPPKGKKQSGTIFINPTLNEWFIKYEAANPKHASLFRMIAGIYIENASLPASPVLGGHGGATLRQHSENVLIEMLAQSPLWEYRGHIGKSGKVLVQPKEGTWSYKDSLSKSPILPLIAYAHDIGKIQCYKLIKDKKRPKGYIKEVQKNHDTVGKRMLITLKEYWELDQKDREILAMAVGYYHHIGSLPLWCDDAVRAASELLIFVDVETGKKEGGEMNEYEDYSSGDMNMQFGSVDTSVSAEDIAKELGIEAPTEVQTISESSEDIQNATPVAKPVATVSKAPNGASDAAKREWIFNMFSEIISEPGRINGGEAKKRIGFKQNGWVYVNDADWRKIAAERVGNDSIAQNISGQISEASHLLLEELKSRDALFSLFDGAEYSTKRALFTINSYLPKHSSAAKQQNLRGSLGTQWQFTVIFKSSLLPHIDAINDNSGVIEVVANGWGEKAAINKAAGRIDAPDGIAGAASVDSDVPATKTAVPEATPRADETEAEKIFRSMRAQAEKEGASDIPFTIEVVGGGRYQCVRIETLLMAHPNVDWDKAPCKKAVDANKNKVICIQIGESDE